MLIGITYLIPFNRGVLILNGSAGWNPSFGTAIVRSCLTVLRVHTLNVEKGFAMGTLYPLIFFYLLLRVLIKFYLMVLPYDILKVWALLF
jgi:hypothetical protein